MIDLAKLLSMMNEIYGIVSFVEMKSSKIA
jgi:hypothetical protein